MRAGIPEYAELRCVSAFTFLRGASRPEELVERAKEQEYAALALTDECSVAGIVRAHVQAKECGLPLIIGSQFRIADAPFTLIVLAQNKNGYGNLCEFISKLRMSSPKGTYNLPLSFITRSALEDCLVLVAPDRDAAMDDLVRVAQWMLTHFTGRCWLAVELLRHITDEVWLHKMREVGELTAIPLVAAGDVYMHVRSRKPLQDVMTATKLHKPVSECGAGLQQNAERHLRSRLRLSYIYPEDLIAETIRVASMCSFSLDEIKYQYPSEVVPEGETASSYLRRLTYEGAGRRWPQGIPAKVQLQIEHELDLIKEVQYEHYFLTVADIVIFARSRHILCQGRGSAANSVVCYCLHVTEVDPARQHVLFERFISKERGEPPDIDIDFENSRREEVMQYLYQRYGRHRAGLTATVASYRPKSAIRDVGKALGMPAEVVDRLAKAHYWFDGKLVMPERLDEVGLSADSLVVKQLLHLTTQLIGLPRHLGQHVGGFVLTNGPLSRMVPIENAAMADRTVIEFDKDDLDALGWLKVDILALGMLTAIRKSLEFVSQRKGYRFEMQDIPPEDKVTYDMISRADTVGVFQIESRAQQAMLPRMRPQTFYDLVIEVALVRPGPIQGGVVHPYLARRQGKEPVTYEKDELKEALGRTLGVAVFQEQVMQLAIIAAGFTAGEADQLRRAMAAWKRKGGLDKYYDKIVTGMTSRGYSLDFAESIYRQIHGFSSYGFPESHAASFALLVYASCWLKCHHPGEFLAAMLNSYPLGFYSPSQLVQDAQRHGVEVRAPDVMHSDYESTLEGLPHPPAVRIGLKMISGLKEDSAERIVAARREAPFTNAEDLARRAGLEQHEMTLLASADALQSLSGHRRQQVWDASALKSTPQLLRDAPIDEDFLELEEAPEGEEVVFDYASLGLTLRSHPLALLRKRLNEFGYKTAEALRDCRNGQMARACGIVTVRQQPDTASGVIFISLEDETGAVQIIARKSIREHQRAPLLQSRLMGVHGVWQREGEVASLVAGRLVDHTELLGSLQTESRDFH